MRLIDADAVINGVRNRCLGQTDVAKAEYQIIDMLNRMPAVDAVPVIRCKDCKRLGVANMKDKYGQPNSVPCCRRNGHIRLGIKPDDYCSRAERKDE